MDSKLSILQWNCQGMQAKYESLKILIQDKYPICISLQETMLGRKILFPKGYVFYHTDYNVERDFHGGSALLLRRDVPHMKLPLQTELQAVAVQIFSKRKYTVCSIYLPPSYDVNCNLVQNLNYLVNQLPRPYLLLGDFNGRHPMWGDILSNSRGNTVFS